jgi:thiol-disulfide isomerase/thioredoxin
MSKTAVAGAALVALGVPLLFSCDKEDKQPVAAPKARSQAVLGTAAATPEPAPPPRPSATLPAAVQRRKLCDGQMQAPGKPLPRSEIARAAAPSVASPSERIAAGDGSWTWVNFWAAWCVPCKEEIPRLKGWERRLTAQGTRFRLVFVSLDDDTRQLEEFLGGQPAEGLQSTYWLKEGDMRKNWLGALEIESDPELPAHLLVDPRGKVRCVVNGAVEDSDYPQVVALLGG